MQPKIYQVVSKNIKKNRLKKRMTQKKLAEQTGYSYEYIRQIESKYCSKKFSLEVIYKISKALNINIKNMFDDNNI